MTPSEAKVRHSQLVEEIRPGGDHAGGAQQHDDPKPPQQPFGGVNPFGGTFPPPPSFRHMLPFSIQDGFKPPFQDGFRAPFFPPQNPNFGINLPGKIGGHLPDFNGGRPMDPAKMNEGQP